MTVAVLDILLTVYISDCMPFCYSRLLCRTCKFGKQCRNTCAMGMVDVALAVVVFFALFFVRRCVDIPYIASKKS